MRENGKELISMQIRTQEKRIQILEYIAASAGAYYEFNMTKDRIPGSVTQYLDGKPYNVNQLIGLPENCRFTQYQSFWGSRLTGKNQEDYFTFFDRERLLEAYAQGQRHFRHTYWTCNVVQDPMLAEHHLILFLDEEKGDVLGVSYIIDKTEHYKKGEYTKQLEQGNKTLSQDLFTERKYLDVLLKNYYTVYHVDLNTDTSLLLKSDPVITAARMGRSQLRRPANYTSRIHQYADMFVVDSSREDFLKHTQRQYLLRVLEFNQRDTFRYRSVPNEAGYQYFEANFIRINPEQWDGHVLLAFRYIDDVINEEQKQQMEAQQRIDREQNQLEMLFAVSQSYYAIFRINLDSDSYEKLSCREEFRHLYGNYASASEELAGVCRAAIVPEDRERMLRFFDLSTLPERIAGKDSIEAECLTLSGDWHRARFIPKRWDEQGRLIQVFYTSKQVNKEKERENTLISIAESATDANVAKTEFVSQIAHDIRTPMNAIVGFLKIAQANLDDRERLTYCLDRILASADYLKELTNDVLDITRMETGKLHLRPVPVNMDQLLRDFTTSMGYSKQEKALDMQFQCDRIFRNRVLLDPLRLRQIYTNLLSNAVKYTPDGGSVSFAVWQEESPVPGRVRLLSRIADTGIGMSEEFMTRMYEKFERATDNRINKISGHGLGLSIVKQIVDQMDGTIDVKSTMGEGTTILVTLDVPYMEEDHVATPSTAPQIGELASRGMHLLIAEDNPLNREVLQELLKMHGITSDCAEDGAECVRIFLNAASDTYDAILMDMQMPNCNGLEATRALRTSALPEATTIPIFAMTANVQKDDIHKCLEAGMNRHLSKPVDMTQLLTALAEIPGKSGKIKNRS